MKNPECSWTSRSSTSGRHRDPRKELLLREGRREELALNDGARRLRRRILLGNIVLPEDPAPRQAEFKLLLTQTLGFSVPRRRGRGRGHDREQVLVVSGVFGVF